MGRYSAEEITEIIKSMNGRLMLNKEDTAKLLSMSTETVDRLAKRGILKPNRKTRRPLYSIYELIRFLQDDSLAA